MSRSETEPDWSIAQAAMVSIMQPERSLELPDDQPQRTTRADARPAPVVPVACPFCGVMTELGDINDRGECGWCCRQRLIEWRS